MSYPKCPYNDKSCPKLSKVEDIAKDNSKDIKTIYKLLYIIIGMIAVNWGLIIW